MYNEQINFIVVTEFCKLLKTFSNAAVMILPAMLHVCTTDFLDLPINKVSFHVIMFSLIISTKLHLYKHYFVSMGLVSTQD